MPLTLGQLSQLPPDEGDPDGQLYAAACGAKVFGGAFLGLLRGFAMMVGESSERRRRKIMEEIMIGFVKDFGLLLPLRRKQDNFDQ